MSVCPNQPTGESVVVIVPVDWTFPPPPPRKIGAALVLVLKSSVAVSNEVGVPPTM
jgi:hypothetical protein